MTRGRTSLDADPVDRRARLPDGSWSIDPQHSEIGFAVKDMVPLEIPVTVERTLDGALRLEGNANVSRATAGVAWNVLGMIRGDATLHAGLTLRPEARKEGGADERP